MVDDLHDVPDNEDYNEENDVHWWVCLGGSRIEWVGNGGQHAVDDDPDGVGEKFGEYLVQFLMGCDFFV